MRWIGYNKKVLKIFLTLGLKQEFCFGKWKSNIVLYIIIKCIGIIFLDLLLDHHSSSFQRVKIGSAFRLLSSELLRYGTEYINIFIPRFKIYLKLWFILNGLHHHAQVGSLLDLHSCTKDDFGRSSSLSEEFADGGSSISLNFFKSM